MNCIICGNQINPYTSLQINDGKICKKCQKSYLKNYIFKSNAHMKIEIYEVSSTQIREHASSNKFFTVEKGVFKEFNSRAEVKEYLKNGKTVIPQVADNTHQTATDNTYLDLVRSQSVLYDYKTLLKMEDALFSSCKFVPTRQITCNLLGIHRIFCIDEKNGLFYLRPAMYEKIPVKIYDLHKINNIIFSENGSTIASSSGALVGGILAGTTGAVIGAAGNGGQLCTNLSIQLYTDDKYNSLETLWFVSHKKGAVEKNTAKFKQTFSFATEIFNILKSQFELIQQETANNASSSNQQNNIAEQLQQIAQLYKDGILTQEEFQNAKDKILK